MASGRTGAAPLIAASIGSYGAYLADGSEYIGQFGKDKDFLKAFHRERLQVLSNSMADIIAFETIPCTEEAIALAELTEELNCKKAWMSFSCQNDSQLCSGEDFGGAVVSLSPFKSIVAVGVNCTAPQYVSSLMGIAASSTSKLVFAYPNKGDVYDAVHKCWIINKDATSNFLEYAQSWFAAGARMVGGCCRTGPHDIKGLANSRF
jgi:homocysteine S-methyltransferase